MTTYKLELAEGYVKPLLPGRDRWLEALRSDKYRQGKDYLSARGCDCCLGVLCKVQGRPQSSDGFLLKFDDDIEVLNTDNPLYSHLSATGDFPEGVNLSINEEDGVEEHTTNLAGCNDAGLTFPQIAEIISQVWTDAPHNWSTMRNPIP